MSTFEAAFVTMFFSDNAIATATVTTMTVNPVPIPAAVWLFGSGLIGLIGIARRKKA